LRQCRYVVEEQYFFEKLRLRICRSLKKIVNVECGYAIKEQYSLKSCEYVVAENLPLSCEIVIADIKKFACASLCQIYWPPIGLLALDFDLPTRFSVLTTSIPS
jgi:hypothetical protein